MPTLFQRATDPLQYDRKNTNWQESFKGLESPTRAHFWEFIKPYFKNRAGQRLLDIGAGTGWLLDLALKEGFSEAIGIDPSKKNIKMAANLYPHVKVVRTTLEEYSCVDLFDVITAIFSLTHIADADLGFQKMVRFLKPKGEIIAIVPNFAYFRLPRKNYEIRYQELNEDEYITQVKRPHGTIADIIRTVKKYQLAAEKSGLRLFENLPMKPTQKLIEKEPIYLTVKDLVMTYLLRFKK